MSTKSTEVVEAPAVAPVNVKRPDSISICTNGGDAWNELMVHVRNGYIVAPGTFPVIFPNGNVSLLLCIGSPAPIAIKKAQETIDRELRAEEARFNERVKEEAKRLVEEQAKADLAKRVAAAEAAAEAAIAKIRADAAAELEKLTK